MKQVLKKDRKDTGKKRLYLLWKSGEGSECQELQISKTAPLTEEQKKPSHTLVFRWGSVSTPAMVRY